jgi:hypothetical protein
MTKAQFALLTAALGLATVAGTGYLAFATASPGSGSPGTGAQGGASTDAQGGGQVGPGVQLSPTDGADSPTPSQQGASPSAEAKGGGKSTGGAPGVVRCGNSDIQVSEQGEGAAAGHVSLLLVFTDIGRQPCVLQDYPGASLLDQDGNSLDAVRTLSGYSGGAVGLSSPPQVVLKPNGTASAVLEWSDVPTGSGPNGGCAMPDPASLAVTPPNTKATSTFALPPKAAVCSGFQIHPVLAGIGNTPSGD